MVGRKDDRRQAAEEGASRARTTVSGLIAGLDVGSSKVSCFIGKQAARDSDRVQIVGVGTCESRGIKSGAIVDMDAAEAVIRTAVERAERMAGVIVSRVSLNFSSARLSSDGIADRMQFPGHALTQRDLDRLLVQARLSARKSDHHVLHAIPTEWALDGSRGIRDPKGLHGQDLEVVLHTVQVPSIAVRNLALAVERSHLAIDRVVAAPYASGLATLVEDEMELGVTCIDMGAGTTSIAIFFDGRMVHLDVLPIGGRHITNDLARGLSTSVRAAERIKTLYGSVLTGPSDDRETVSVPQVGEEDGESEAAVPRSLLVGIVRPRLEETFEMVRDKLEASGLAHLAGRRVVLCGGASQLSGARELATSILNRQVRLGRPLRMSGAPEAMSGPGFAAVAGLTAFPLRAPREAPKRRGPDKTPRPSFFGRLFG